MESLTNEWNVMLLSYVFKIIWRFWVTYTNIIAALSQPIYTNISNISDVSESSTHIIWCFRTMQTNIFKVFEPYIQICLMFLSHMYKYIWCFWAIYIRIFHFWVIYTNILFLSHAYKYILLSEPRIQTFFKSHTYNKYISFFWATHSKLSMMGWYSMWNR